MTAGRSLHRHTHADTQVMGNLRCCSWARRMASCCCREVSCRLRWLQKSWCCFCRAAYWDWMLVLTWVTMSALSVIRLAWGSSQPSRYEGSRHPSRYEGSSHMMREAVTHHIMGEAVIHHIMTEAVTHHILREAVIHHVMTEAVTHHITREAVTYHIMRETVIHHVMTEACLLYTSPSPRDQLSSRMPSSA